MLGMKPINIFADSIFRWMLAGFVCITFAFCMQFCIVLLPSIFGGPKTSFSTFVYPWRLALNCYNMYIIIVICKAPLHAVIKIFKIKFMACIGLNKHKHFVNKGMVIRKKYQSLFQLWNWHKDCTICLREKEKRTGKGFRFLKGASN